MTEVSLLAAFFAGVLSFISPCVLPLVPGYLSFVSGITLDEMRGSGGLQPGAVSAQGSATAAPLAVTSSLAKRRVFVSSLAFVLGFSLVFVALGASATALGKVLLSQLTLLGKVAGIVIIVFGLHTMGVLRIGWLYKEKRFQAANKPAGPLGAMLVGIAFAFGWTPCIGPILGAILTLGMTQETVSEGVTLLAVYSMGLGIPFLATSLAVNQFFAAFSRIRRHFHAIEVTAGLLMVAIGLLIFTNRFTVIAQFLTPYLPTF